MSFQKSGCFFSGSWLRYILIMFTCFVSPLMQWKVGRGYALIMFFGARGTFCVLSRPPRPCLVFLFSFVHMPLTWPFGSFCLDSRWPFSCPLRSSIRNLLILLRLTQRLKSHTHNQKYAIAPWNLRRLAFGGWGEASWLGLRMVTSLAIARHWRAILI